MCQVQWSAPMLPSAAAMPPWAATVWERGGNTLVMQAGLRPFSAAPLVGRRPRGAGGDHLGEAGGFGALCGRARGGAQAGAAGADDDDVVAMVDTTIGGARL